MISSLKYQERRPYSDSETYLEQQKAVESDPLSALMLYAVQSLGQTAGLNENWLLVPRLTHPDG